MTVNSGGQPRRFHPAREALSAELPETAAGNPRAVIAADGFVCHFLFAHRTPLMAHPSASGLPVRAPNFISNCGPTLTLMDVLDGQPGR